MNHTGVCEKNTPPEKRTWGKITFKNTESGAGEQFLQPDCSAEACVNREFKDVVFEDVMFDNNSFATLLYIVDIVKSM